MSSIEFGLHERLVTRALAEALAKRDASAVHTVEQPVDPEDSHLTLARHVFDVLSRALRALPSTERVERQTAICNRLIDLIRSEGPPNEGAADGIDAPARELLALIENRPLEGARVPARPTTPLARSALLTNAPDEPAVGRELALELESATDVDLLCAFVKWAGIRVLIEPLKRFFARGGRMRVLTTTYMAVTEGPALDKLAALGADVRVAYEPRTTSLHAKAWLFKRPTGFSTAYVGSSNLSRRAMLDGLEWNVRLSQVDAAHILHKFEATFESYWESDQFEPYDAARFDMALGAARGEQPMDVLYLDLRPYPHQTRILDDLRVERERHGRTRNLVVAATGTGKTVVAAFDYRRLRNQHGAQTLLFVAHRSEILQQSLRTFRTVLRDGSFGELYVGGQRPDAWRHVFASIQSLQALGPRTIDPQHFDVVIVDEFHHAAAATYRRLLEHVQPKYLLGLTATPERADGRSVAEWFGGRFASELRLWEALEERLLSPFQYFGVSDDVDVSSVRWERGYDLGALDKLYTGNDVRVSKVVQALRDIVPDPREMRALGFCVSVAHAEFMADRFSRVGIPSVAVSASTPRPDREAALRSLRDKVVNVVFAVDLFNEGVDVPEIDTVLFLRPTESATVFMQQLGRGLRLTEDKPCLTVLDFIGRQHQRFRFDVRFRALVGGTRADIARQVERGFPFLPAGCHIELDRVAQATVLENVRSAVRANRLERAAELRDVGDVSLTEFLERADLELEDVYRSGGWTALRRAAGLPTPVRGPDEDVLERAVGRMLHVDDPERITVWRSGLAAAAPPGADTLSLRDARTWAMLHYDLWGTRSSMPLDESLARLWSHDAVRAELVELLSILDDSARRVMTASEEWPLWVHGRYSRDEVLAALGASTPERARELREGVLYHEGADVFFVTLHKSERDYSPTTMYRDYAISPTLFHWESQTGTSLASPTGQRYMRPETRPLLFVRERKDGQMGAEPYLFLGRGSYVSHVGERPISVTWRLDHPMPADTLLQSSVVAI